MTRTSAERALFAFGIPEPRMFQALNDWIVKQIPPVVLLALGLLGWAGFLVFTPQRLNALEQRITSLEERQARSDRAMDALVKRACWDSTPEQQLWLGVCDAIRGNNPPGGPGR